ncbi:MAG: hypothetical protein GY707_05625 [Desulfobacteraceae bacterium]|nr:hypothetical protein [Desulfobacteraceae bacterium]
MSEFLEELGVLLEWYESNPIDTFTEKFDTLVDKYRKDDDVLDIANIVAHNYNCHHYGREDALIENMEQYKKLTEKREYY